MQEIYSKLYEVQWCKVGIGRMRDFWRQKKAPLIMKYSKKMQFNAILHLNKITETSILPICRI